MKATTRSGSDVTLVNWNGTDRDVARAAKVSFGKDEDPRLDDEAHVKGLINFLIREGHWSPFDHGTATFLIQTPIFVAREQFRHRTGQYNEISGRYAAWDFEFYVPDTTRPVVQQGKAGQYRFTSGTPDQHAMIITKFANSYQKAIESYNDLLDAGVAKEVARDVLPLGLYTKYYATYNVRNLMNFIRQRSDEQALYEIREVANKMERHLEENMPFTYSAWKEHHGG